MMSRYPFEPAAKIGNYSRTDLSEIAKFLRCFVKSLPRERVIEWR
jgi:hypothetical protein